MPLHIDLIENDGLAGQQRVVASLSVDRGKYDLSSPDPSRWTRVLDTAKLPSPPPYEGVEALLWTVCKRIQGDYVFATEPHDAQACPYPPSVPMQQPGAVRVVERPAVTA